MGRILGATVTLVVSVTGGVAVGVFAGDMLQSPSHVIVLGSAVVLATAALISLRRSASYRGPGLSAALLSLLFATISLLGVALPAVARLDGEASPTLLTVAGLPASNDPKALASACTLTVAALCFLILGQAISAASLRRQSEHGDRVCDATDGLDRQGRRVYCLLVGLWVVQLLLFSQRSVDEAVALRALQSGEGVRVAMGWALALGCAYAILKRHFNSRIFVCINAAVLLNLATGVTRSPLILVGVAGLLRFIDLCSRRKFTLSALAGFLAAIYMVSLLLSGISAYRGQVRAGQSTSYMETLLEQPSSFEAAHAISGLNSLDGILLVQQYVDPEVLGLSIASELYKPVIAVVPSAWLPFDKPEWTSVQIAHKYLGWKQGGVFYSGQGWAQLIFGSVGLLLFTMIGFAGSRLVLRLRWNSVGTLLVLYGLARFFASGDTFNLFHVVMLAGVFVLARGLSGILEPLMTRTSARKRSVAT